MNTNILFVILLFSVFVSTKIEKVHKTTYIKIRTQKVTIELYNNNHLVFGLI